MQLFGYHITRNIGSGRLELWREECNWVITSMHNDTSTNEHIRIGDWVCSAKRIVPYIFKVTFHHPL